MKIYNNTDTYERKHTYLRVSITDKCNLSCLYCLPPKEQKISCCLLTTEEILKFISLSARFGIKKVRFTGGEPLLRNDIDQIIENTKNIPGIEKVCITTNGILLKNKVRALKNAGLDSINISLDSLHSERFKKITGSDKFYDVIRGIHLVINCNLKLKINVVALSDLSFDEVDEFVSFAMDNSIAVRFIELMPFCGESFIHNGFISLDRIEEYIISKYRFSSYNMDGVARSYQIGPGIIGFISPISQPFCSNCNRLRLSSKGLLYRCLFDEHGLDIKDFLNENPQEQLLKKIEYFLLNKTQSHKLKEDNLSKELSCIKNSMRSIGG